MISCHHNDLLAEHFEIDKTSVMSWLRDLQITGCTWLINFIFLSWNLICLNLIFLATAMSFFLYCFIVVTTSSLSYQLGYQSTLALSIAEVVRVACEPSKQFASILSLQEKTTCRPTLLRIWCWWSERSTLTLYKEKLLEEPQVKW